MKRILTALLAVVLVSGCSAEADQTNQAALNTSQIGTQVNGIQIKATLDAAQGSVNLPLSRFTPDPWEANVLTMGGASARALCSAEQGAKYQIAPITEKVIYGIYLSRHYFGPWTEAQAQKFGFVEPMTDADMYFNEIDGAPAYTPSAGYESDYPDLTDEQTKIRDACTTDLGTLTDQALSQADGWYRETTSLEQTWESYLEAQSVMDELTACYSQKGLKASKDQPWFPEGTNARVINEQQITMALKTVECKTNIDFTQRMADIEAALQAPMVEKYGNELAAKRATIDNALKESEELLANHPELFLHEK